MTSKELKPFLFWIVCGAILLVELVAGVILQPKLVAAKGTKPVLPHQAAKDFNAAFDKLINEFDSRSQNTARLVDGRIELVIDPEDKKTIDAVLDRKTGYIVGRSWEGIITARQTAYQGIIKNLRELLVVSSRDLYRDIGTISGDAPRIWYDDYYRREVIGLVQRLLAGGVLEVPRELRQPDGSLDEVAIKNDTDGGKFRSLRELVGLRTFEAPTGLLKVEEFQKFVRSFHLARITTLPLVEARGSVAADPRFATWTPAAAEGQAPEPIPGAPPPDPDDVRLTRVQLVKVEIKDAEAASGRSATDPRVWEVTLTLRGSAGALFGALRSLDGLREPIAIRLLTRWEPLPPADEKARMDTERSDVAFQVEAKLGICDFSHFEQPAAPRR